jgi:hypothetical protein
MVSHDYFDENSDVDRIPEIIKRRLNISVKPPPDPAFRRELFGSSVQHETVDYLLTVSTIEPRKNQLALLTAWERLRLVGFPKLKLVIVGALGWHHESIVRKFRPWTERAELFMLEDVAAPELRVLYKHARATVCPSVGEGFDFSGVEAMKSGGAVVASDIAVHREIYADAAVYFNPYSVDELANALLSLISDGNSAYRTDLVNKGATIATRYSHQNLINNWHQLFTSGLR